ncbi:MAG: anti-sigma factor family protein [Candidatus Sulfotelmatobacter sp.]
MPSEDQIQLVHAYLDGELDPFHSLAVEQQIAADPRLATEFARAKAIGSALRTHIHREEVPAGLRRRIAAIAPARRSPRPTWSALAASVMVAVGLSAGSTFFALRLAPDSYLRSEIVDSHVRSLIASTPTEVSTSDRHAVKPWFNGRIPQAPRVVDLHDAGFPLIGARIDVIATTPVPTLVYKRRQHVISLVAVPASISPTILTSTHHDAGYKTVQWADATTTFFATSDLNAEELAAFSKLFREASGG